MMRRLSMVVLVLAALSGSGAARAFDDAFKALGFTWDVSGRPIPVSLEPNGSDDVDDDSDLEAVRASLRAWACTEGTSIRFEETEEPGIVSFDSDDVNSIFWDEDGSVCLMGAGVLGIGGGDGNQGDVCFNGLHHTWGVGERTDIQSIAMHEIGHFIGIAHPCDNDQNEDSCLPASDAIMFPSWSGSPERELLKSDIAAVTTLYPADPDIPSGCEGPFGPGEKCGCNDDCVEGTICVPDVEGTLRCGFSCSANDSDCGDGSVCVLDVPNGDDPAPGICVNASDDKPAGSVCTQNGECASGSCLTNFELRRSICTVACQNDGDCGPAGSCFENVCLGGFEDTPCSADDGDEPETCGNCSAASPGLGSLALVLLLLLRRRRTP